MFKKHSLQVRMVKNNPANSDEPKRPKFTPDDFAEYATIAAYWTKKATIGAVGVYAVVKTLNTASEIAINAAPKR